MNENKDNSSTDIVVRPSLWHTIDFIVIALALAFIIIAWKSIKNNYKFLFNDNFFPYIIGIMIIQLFFNYFFYFTFRSEHNIIKIKFPFRVFEESIFIPFEKVHSVSINKINSKYYSFNIIIKSNENDVIINGKWLSNKDMEAIKSFFYKQFGENYQYYINGKPQ